MKKNRKKSRKRRLSCFQAFVKSHRAQIRMSETIAVMFIFFVLIVFGIVFYYKYSQVSFKEKQEELMGARAMEITLQSLFLPELICSRGEAEPWDNCFDMMKLRQVGGVFSDNFENYYFDLFPYTRITVRQLYPEVGLGDETEMGCEIITDELGNDEGCEWVVYDKEKKTIDEETGEEVSDWTRKEATHFVVTLRDETKRGESEYGFGFLTVEVYS